jgi:hypothetical protein
MYRTHSGHHYLFVVVVAETPDKEILWASENGKFSVVEKLILANPAIIHAKDKDGYTPLHRACYNNHEHVLDVSICLDYCWNGFRIRSALHT